ncbi:hypothetical protein RB595_006932 [Gaeumannomyces hyphopodioides]
MEPVYRGRGPTVILWTETSLAAIFVGFRIYTRKAILHSLGLDGLFLIVTFLLLAIYSAFISAATHYGLGRRRVEISMDSYAQAMKLEIIGQAICIFNIATARAAVAFFLLRIVVERRHRVFVYACIVTNSAITAMCSAPVGMCGIVRTTAPRSPSSIEKYIFDTVDVFIYSGTENFVSIVCTSIPVLRPLWHKVLGYTTADKSSSSDSYRLRSLRGKDPEAGPGGGASDGTRAKAHGGGRRGDDLVTAVDELKIYAGDNPGGQRRFETRVERAGSEESILGSMAAPSLHSLQSRGSKGVVHIQRDFSINVTGQRG